MPSRLLLVPLLLGFETVIVFAQPAPKSRNLERTWGQLNGRAWRAYSVQARLAFLEGVESALEAAYFRASHTPCEHQTGLVLEAYRMPGFRGSEEMAAIDQFYAEPENLLVGLSDAIEIVAAKARGVPQQEIDSRLSEHRRKANEAPERK